jgi:MoxR-like ATPase
MATDDETTTPLQRPGGPAAAPPEWYVYKGPREARTLPAAPPWRRHDTEPNDYAIAPAGRDDTFQPDASDIAMVNAAIYLRRPLLVTGRPGSGKSSLAHSVARELKLGRVLVWSINSRSTLQDGLYHYDALARLQDVSRPGASHAPIGRYLRLGALGTALLPRSRPRVVLIDEIDKSDIDLPNDLLHVFERGSFEVPELVRASEDNQALSVTPADATSELAVASATIQCREFPIVILTSNGERDFPPAFLRRCLRLDMAPPQRDRLERIVEAHFRKAERDDPRWKASVDALLARFLELRDVHKEMVATDQLLNALHFVHSRVDLLADAHKPVLDAVLRGLVTKSDA